ncbi:MAG: FMN-binding protein [Eubacteriales bacterium]|nr:FMN-binding protein [Eubacteriales bacterium]
MAKKKKVLYPVVFMIVITVAFTSVLAIINEVSAERIQQQSKLKEQSKVLYAFNIEFGETGEEIIRQYNQFIEERKVGNRTYYVRKANDEITGYAFKIEGAGLWGSIDAVLAFTQDFNKLSGVAFLNHSETPGLGGRIDEEWFQEQFRDISLDVTATDPYLIFKPSTGGNVDTISGATSTSKAVLNIFNQNIDVILTETKGDVLNE